MMSLARSGNDGQRGVVRGCGVESWSAIGTAVDRQRTCEICGRAIRRSTMSPIVGLGLMISDRSGLGMIVLQIVAPVYRRSRYWPTAGCFAQGPRLLASPAVRFKIVSTELPAFDRSRPKKVNDPAVDVITPFYCQSGPGGSS